jgi:hypothetical protein
MNDPQTRMVAGLLVGALLVLVLIRKGIDVHAGVSPA